MIEIEGTIFTPDYRSKQKVLYNVIASRESEIKNLNEIIKTLEDRIVFMTEEIVTLKARKKRVVRKRRQNKPPDPASV